MARAIATRRRTCGLHRRQRISRMLRGRCTKLRTPLYRQSNEPLSPPPLRYRKYRRRSPISRTRTINQFAKLLQQNLSTPDNPPLAFSTPLRTQMSDRETCYLLSSLASPLSLSERLA